MRDGTALLLLWPARDRTSSPGARKGDADSTWSSDFNTHGSYGPLWAMEINTDTSCSRTKDPDMAHHSSLGLDITMAQGGSTGHPEQDGPSGSMALRHQHDLRGLARPQVSA